MILRKPCIAVFIALLLFALPAGAQQSSSYSKMADEILVLVNRHRSGLKLNGLKMDPVISRACEKHSANMATHKIPFGHEGFDERMAGLRKQIKPTYGWAENVAQGQMTAQKVVDMWLHSPGHKKNIEGDYNLSGIGIVKGKDGDLYFTQIFLKKGN